MNNRVLNAIVILAVAILVISTLGGALAATPSHTETQTYKSPTILQGIQNSEKLPLEKRIKQVLSADKIPAKYAFLPSMEKRFSYNGEQVTPLYTQAPAPMGLGDFGLKLGSNGQLVPYTYSTSSFEASIQVNSLNDFYMLDGAPYSVTFQLNTVLNHVTLFGNSSYVFWNQNVVFYSARTQELTFVDNIWNFSSSAFYMSPNSIYSGYGTLVPGTFYYAIGPTFKVSYPFTVNLYLNSTVINGDTAVYFNYTVIYSNGTSVSNSYDRVLFNSTYGMPTGYVAPKPYYLVSGSEITPDGYLLNDAEIMIGGPGGGSTAMIYNINAMMNLYYYSGSTKSYHNVPAAFDFGTDTGETSEGVAVSWIGETAILNAGPSFLYGMWNASTSNKMESFNGYVNPSNAFLFVSQGSEFNESLSTWAPLSITGQYSFTLPYDNYSAYLLMSNYNPQIINNMGSLLNVRMTKNMSMGIYTPLYAFSNSQLQYISYSGNGSANNPLLIFNNQYSSINPIFSQFNDYAFPSFSGVLIANTNLYVDLENMPSLEIVYPESLYPFLNYYVLPVTNYLNYEFYNTSYLSLVDTQMISGWFSAQLNEEPILASVLFWNSTHDLIANNNFYSMGISLMFYNNNATKSNNVIWGNYFYQSPYVTTLYELVLAYARTPTGLYLYSGGNLIYNNYFEVQNPAINPDWNIYWGVQTIYFNIWNISKEPLSYSMDFNGFTLKGNVLNTGYQGGNFWYNFNGNVPFNDLGLIASGGDSLPLDFTQVNLTFVEAGLAPGTVWEVAVINPVNMLTELFESNTSTIVFYVLPGLYYALVSPVTGYMQNVSLEVFNVVSNQVMYVTYSKLYTVTFYETGIPNGTPWSVTMNGLTLQSTSNNITFNVTTGNYSYQVSEIPGYVATPSSGYINVVNSSVSQNILFKPVLYNVTFTESGLSSGTWGITINNVTKTASAGNSITFTLPNGTYKYNVNQVNGYQSNVQNGYIYVNNGASPVNIVYSKILVNAVFTESGLPANTAWSVEINSQVYTTISNTLQISLPYGTYNYNVISPGYIATPPSGTFTINGTQVTFGISFTQAKYQVMLVESGLSSGTSWGINVAGSSYTIRNASMTLSLPNGTYPFYVYNIPGYNITPNSGEIVVNGNSVTEDFTFTELNYTITFFESGLPSGSTWSVTLNGVTKSSSSTTITFTEHYGTYSYTINYPTGYTSSITSGTISPGMLTVNPTITLPTYSTGLSALDLTLIIIVIILIIIVIVEGIYLSKNRRKEGVKPWNEPKEENKEQK
ncbi:MAG: thermopsin family protease [Thermoplasmata archaeon]